MGLLMWDWTEGSPGASRDLSRRSKAMFFLAGAAAGVLDTLGSLAASSALHGAAGAAVSGQAFNLGSSTNSPAAAPSGADGGVGGSRSSPGTMNALLSMQGRFGAGQAAPDGSTVRGYGHHHRYGIDLRQSLAGPSGASPSAADADSSIATTVTNADSGKLGRLIQQQARLSAAAAGQSLSTTA
jgi:hypothetical protein